MYKVSSVAIVASLLIGCANGNSDNVSQERQPAIEQEAVNLKERSAYEIKPDNTYVELITGKRVKLQYDDATGRITEQVSNREIDYFIDEATHDTVDANGQVMNNRLVKKPDGTYVSSGN